MSRILAIVGPTASGKTRRAVDVARAIGGEILSGDSRQVYRGMDLGTGKDLDEYEEIPYHLIDVAPAGSKYNLYGFLRDAGSVLDVIVSRGKVPVVCGGTGLYVESLLKGMRLPEVPVNAPLRRSLDGKTLAELTDILAGMKSLHNTTDIDSAKRAVRAIEIQTYYNEHPESAESISPSEPLDAVIIGVDIDREARRRRITRRLDARLEAGMADEVRALLASGVTAEDLMYYGLEYKFLTRYVIGELTFEEMRSGLEIAIHQFAKRQMTWFRGMERRGFKIHWLPYDMDRKAFVEECLHLYGRK